MKWTFLGVFAPCRRAPAYFLGCPGRAVAKVLSLRVASGSRPSQGDFLVFFIFLEDPFGWTWTLLDECRPFWVDIDPLLGGLTLLGGRNFRKRRVSTTSCPVCVRILHESQFFHFFLECRTKINRYSMNFKNKRAPQTKKCRGEKDQKKRPKKCGPRPVCCCVHDNSKKRPKSQLFRGINSTRHEKHICCVFACTELQTCAATPRVL